MRKVAVVGLGAMGGRMARRLLEAGHEVTVWNRTSARMAALAEFGARPAPSPAAAAGQAEAVITMVSDPDALAAVTAGPDGVLAGLDRKATLIQMATVGVEPVLALASALPAAEQLLDAPVLGSLTEVESGSLTVFAGGAPDLVRHWTPTLSALGTVMHVGPPGAGAAAKLVANSTLFGMLGVLGEALALGEALGLPGGIIFDVLSRTPIAPQAQRRRAPVESGEFPLRFELALAVKDTDLVVQAGQESGADLRLAQAARSWFADAARVGRGGHDYSEVLAHIVESARAGLAGSRRPGTASFPFDQGYGSGPGC